MRMQLLVFLGPSLGCLSAASAQPWRVVDKRGNVKYTSSPAELPPERRARVLKRLEEKRAAAAEAKQGQAGEKPADDRKRPPAVRTFASDEALARRNNIKSAKPKRRLSNGSAKPRTDPAQMAALEKALEDARSTHRGLQKQMKAALQGRAIARRDANALQTVPKIQARNAAEARVKTLISDIATAAAAEKAASAALRAAR